MEHSPKTGGEACNRAAAKRTTTTRHTSIVGQRFGEAHADGRAERRGKADKKSTKRLTGEPAAAKIGANVETEPSINPGDPAGSPAAPWHCDDDLPALDFPESSGVSDNTEH